MADRWLSRSGFQTIMGSLHTEYLHLVQLTFHFYDRRKVFVRF